MLVDYGLKFLGTPYRWGGNSVLTGLDCSGFVQEVLASVGKDPRGDQTAQGLFNKLLTKTNYSPKNPGRNDLLFFGSDSSCITHVAIALGPTQMLEAGGGDSTTTNIEKAGERRAMVRVRPIRKDLIGILSIDIREDNGNLNLPFGN